MYKLSARVMPNEERARSHNKSAVVVPTPRGFARHYGADGPAGDESR